MIALTFIWHLWTCHFFPRRLIVCPSTIHWEIHSSPSLVWNATFIIYSVLVCFFIYGLYSWSVCNSGTVLYCCNSVTSSLPQECPRFAGACFHLGSITDYYCYFFCCSNCLALLLQNSSFQMGPVHFHLTLTLCCDHCSFWGHGMPPGPLVALCPSPGTCLWLREVALLWGPAVKGARKSMWEASVRNFCVPHGRSCQNWESDLLEKRMCQLTHSACALFFPPPPSFSIKTVFQSCLSTSLFSTLFGESYFGEVARLLCPSRYSISGSPRHLVGSSELCLC